MSHVKMEQHALMEAIITAVPVLLDGQDETVQQVSKNYFCIAFINSLYTHMQI